MLRDAGHGVVMANGVAPCKEVAKVVSEWTNAEAAVAKELDKLLAAGEIVSADPSRKVVPPLP